MLPGFSIAKRYVWVDALQFWSQRMQSTLHNFAKIFALDRTQSTGYASLMNPLTLARERRGLSQQDLATITGFKRQFIQRYEAGRSNTPPVELCAFLDDTYGYPLGHHAQLYVDWINSRRARLPLSLIKAALDPSLNVPPVVVPKVALAEIRKLIEDLSDVRPVANNKRMTDEYFVSATMHLHPYSIQKWQQSGNIPTTILEVVNEHS